MRNTPGRRLVDMLGWLTCKKPEQTQKIAKVFDRRWRAVQHSEHARRLNIQAMDTMYMMEAAADVAGKQLALGQLAGTNPILGGQP